MRQSLKNKIEKFVKSSEFPRAVYYSECPINYNDDYHGCKYFFVYHNTHTIYKGFTSQNELNDFLNEHEEWDEEC